jgi:hypothetical protein
VTTQLNGCTYSDQVMRGSEAPDAPSNTSLNGDGGRHLGYFGHRGTLCQVYIYDRWGQKVFSTGYRALRRHQQQLAAARGHLLLVHRTEPGERPLGAPTRIAHHTPMKNCCSSSAW